MKKTTNSAAAGSGESSKMHNTLVYFRQHWQLYIIFMLPAFLLTLVFKYFPMGGLIIAFQKYNSRLGILGSKFIGLDNFTRFLTSPEFPKLMGNTLKLSVFGLLWGFLPPVIIALVFQKHIISGLSSGAVKG